MQIRKRQIFLFLAVLLYCAWAVSPAYAHALLLRSNPAANATLTEGPAQVELYFTEALEPTLSTVSVFDSNGNVVDLGDIKVDPSDPTRMTVSLHSLTDGVYTVSWKAISATDGHLTTGSFPFAVGSGNAQALAARTTQTNAGLPASALISKWLLLASLALLVGQIPFIYLIWKPAVRLSGQSLPYRVVEPLVWETVTKIGLIALFLGLAIGILSEAGQATGNELAWPWSAEASRVILQTRLGLIWLARLGLAFADVWLIKSRSAKWKPWAALAAGFGLLFTISLTSHAATETDYLLPVLSDSLHMTGMCFWFGGLAYLLTGLRVIRELDAAVQTRLTSLTMNRFSLMALISVGVIGVTGLYAAWLRVGAFSALITSLYGNTLLLKQVFVGALLLLAAGNLLFIGPRLKKARLAGGSDSKLVARFRRVVMIESILAGGLLLTVSFLTYIPPAKINPPVQQQVKSMTADDLHIKLTIAPGYVGQNTFTVQLTSGGKPVNVVKDATLRFTPDKNNVSPSEAQLLAQGNGIYSIKGSYLSLPGNWQVEAIIRRENKFDAYAPFNYQVGAPGSNLGESQFPIIAGGIIFLDGLLFVLVLFGLRGKPVLRFGAGGVLAATLIGAGLFYLSRPTQVVNSEANPIPPNAQSIAAGEARYQVSCVPCHGATGKGDGPLGLTLIPRPADLTLHAIPGVHTDAQLYDWITNGFPGSAMPAFKNTISDTDRWNLVNYIRTLAPKQQ